MWLDFAFDPFPFFACGGGVRSFLENISADLVSVERWRMAGCV
jgi:hypothetical protein